MDCQGKLNRIHMDNLFKIFSFGSPLLCLILILLCYLNFDKCLIYISKCLNYEQKVLLVKQCLLAGTMNNL